MGPQQTGLAGGGTVYLLIGSVVLSDSATDAFRCQLVDNTAGTATGNTTGVYQSSEIVTLSTQTITTITFTGIATGITSAGIQCIGSNATGAAIKANVTGGGKDSHIDTVRIQ